MSEQKAPDKAIRPVLEKATRDKTLLKMMMSSEVRVTKDELDYFRRHPDEIDEVTAPVTVHKFFLILGSVFGIVLVFVSKLIDLIPTDSAPMLMEFLVDIVFEIGVALIGGGVTAYLLGILLSSQQDRAKHWRREIRQRIREPGK